MVHISNLGYFFLLLHENRKHELKILVTIYIKISKPTHNKKLCILHKCFKMFIVDRLKHRGLN